MSKALSLLFLPVGIIVTLMFIGIAVYAIKLNIPFLTGMTVVASLGIVGMNIYKTFFGQFYHKKQKR